MTNDAQWRTRATLLGKIKDQYNESAWEDFVFVYRKFILSVIRAMGVGHHDSEDLAQEVMLIAWRRLPEFNYDPGTGRFRGWLSRVTSNAVKSFFRKQKRTPENQSLDDENAAVPSIEIMSQPEIEEIAEKEWRKHAYDMAWRKIQSTFSEKVFGAYDLSTQGVDPQEIARKLEISQSCVYIYKKRIKNRLQKLISEIDYDLT